MLQPSVTGQPGQWSFDLSGLFVQLRGLTGQPDSWDTPPARVLAGSWKRRCPKEECVPSPSPRGTYQVISQALRERIAAGAYLDGLPSEAEIGREFGVACTTVRRALHALEESGDIKTVAGVDAVSPGALGPHRTNRSWRTCWSRSGRATCLRVRAFRAKRTSSRSTGVSRHGSPRRA